MTRIALIALLTVSAAAASASEPLSVTVSDRSVPAFLISLEADTPPITVLDVSMSGQDSGSRAAHSAEARAIFAQLAAEN